MSLPVCNGRIPILIMIAVPALIASRARNDLTAQGSSAGSARPRQSDRRLYSDCDPSRSYCAEEDGAFVSPFQFGIRRKGINVFHRQRGVGGGGGGEKGEKTFVSDGVGCMIRPEERLGSGGFSNSKVSVMRLGTFQLCEKDRRRRRRQRQRQVSFSSVLNAVSSLSSSLDSDHSMKSDSVSITTTTESIQPNGNIVSSATADTHTTTTAGSTSTTNTTSSSSSASTEQSPPPSSSTINTKTVTGTKKNPWSMNDATLLHRAYKPNRVPTDIDYIIIGSGIGGLWLGACLARFDITALVLEQHYIAGGLQHTFRRGPYEFVPGLHYIANLPLCRPLYEMVADNGDNNNSTIKYCRAGNSTKADVAADEYALSSHDVKIGDLPVMHIKEGATHVRSELCRYFPNETRAVDAFINIMEKAKWQAGQFATFKIFHPPWLQFVLSQFVCSSYIKYASMTTEEVLSELTSDGRLKTVLSAFGGDLGESISEGSFVMQAAVLGHVLEGCHYPEGGPIQFARGLIPPIRRVGGDVLVKARVGEILIENDGRATGVKLVNGDVIRSKKGVISDAGMGTTLFKLVPKKLIEKGGPLHGLARAVKKSSGGISHVFTFVGFNATNDELGLRSSSYYYIPCNATRDMNATAIQDFYRDTLLDPTVEDVSAGIVFATAKDPYYSQITMPGKSTAIIFSEARDSDFLALLEEEGGEGDDSRRRMSHHRSQRYKEAKELVKKKMMRSLLLNFPHLEPYIEVVEVGTPLTMFDYTLRTETLGLRHTPQRMSDMELRPDCRVPGLYFTGQDVAFAGWAGALTGAMVTAQLLLGYTLWDFMNKRTLMRDLGAADVEDMIQDRVKRGTASTPIEVMAEIWGNAVRHVKRMLRGDV